MEPDPSTLVLILYCFVWFSIQYTLQFVGKVWPFVAGLVIGSIGLKYVIAAIT